MANLNRILRVAFPGGGGGGALTFIAETDAMGATGQTTSGIDTSGANLLIVGTSEYNGGTPATLSDSKGNTWNHLTAQNWSETNLQLHWCSPSSVGPGHTFTFTNGGSIFGGLAVLAFSGANVSPFDTQNGASSGVGAATFQPGSITPAVDNSLIVSLFGGGATIQTITVDSGMTITANYDYIAGTREALALAYLIQGAKTAINPTWSIGGTTGPQGAVIASFKP